MAASFLPIVPPKLVENIVESLDLASIKNLRLTCEALSTNALGARFRTFMHHQVTDLTERSIRNLEDLVRYDNLRLAVTGLTVQAKGFALDELQRALKGKKKALPASASYCHDCYIEGEEFPDTRCKHQSQHLKRLKAERDQLAKMDSESMARRLASILQKLGKLESLVIEVVVETGRDDIEVSMSNRPDWKGASKPYAIVMDAVTQSQVQITNLTIGSKPSPETEKADVLSRSMITYAQQNKTGWFQSTGKHIKSFTIGTSGWCRANQYASNGLSHQAWHNAAIDMLRCMPDLASLDIRQFNPGLITAAADLASDLNVAQVCPNLTTLRLDGLVTIQPTLLPLLATYRKLEHFSLTRTLLLCGEWQDIFDQLAGMQSLQSVFLAHLTRPTIQFIFTAVNLDPFIGGQDGQGVVKNEDKWAHMEYHEPHIPLGFFPLIVANAFSREDLDKGLRMVRDPRGVDPHSNGTAELLDVAKTNEKMKLLEEAWQRREEAAREVEAKEPTVREM